MTLLCVRCFGAPDLTSVAVFFAEVLKLVAAVLLLAHELHSLPGALRQIRSLASEHSRETLQFAVPALCYTLQNNLWCAMATRVASTGVR